MIQGLYIKYSAFTSSSTSTPTWLHRAMLLCCGIMHSHNAFIKAIGYFPRGVTHDDNSKIPSIKWRFALFRFICYKLTIWHMPSHVCEDHVDAQDRLFYTPSQALCKNFNIQLKVIPQKQWQCCWRNCRIHEGRHILEKKNNNQAAGILMQKINHHHHRWFYNTKTVQVAYGRG